MVVAIDGPAGAGKSTVARAVARTLGFAYLDSGAMYRCVGLLSLAQPAEPPGHLARTARFELGGTPPGEPSRIMLDGRDVTEVIRAPEVSQAASRVAADLDVRKALLAKQQELMAHGDWVAEGRDIGTVVAPNAELKVFLTASAEERARRRAAELGTGLESVRSEQAQRDERDATRTHSPLQAAPDAVILDTTGLTVPEVVARIAALATRASTAT
jgi:cytidylate kinase